MQIHVREEDVDMHDRDIDRRMQKRYVKLCHQCCDDAWLIEADVLSRKRNKQQNSNEYLTLKFQNKCRVQIWQI